MAPLIPILIGIAAQVGAPLVKSVLEKHAGPLAGSVAESVINAVIEKTGREPDDEMPEGALKAAVRAVEAEAPELVGAWTERQRLANELQLAEMAKEQTWTWAWRPAWMWLLAGIWTYALVLRPLVNAAVGASIEAVDLSVLMTLTGAYLALYMGGHTVKDIFGGRK